MYICMYSTQFCKQKTYINGIAAQKFDYNMRNKRGKNKYRRTIQKNNRSHVY